MKNSDSILKLFFNTSEIKEFQSSIQDILPAVDFPPRRYHHPPALIPVFSNGSSGIYYGLWVHDYNSRNLSFVIYDFELRTATEIAQTREQFFACILIISIVIFDEITADIERFAKNLNIEYLLEMADDYSCEHGDDLSQILNCPVFKKHTPLVALSKKEQEEQIKERYFFGKKRRFFSNFFDACFDKANALTYSTPIDQTFYTLLEDQNIEDAWAVLNSQGWHANDTCNALKALIVNSDDHFFSPISEFWIENFHKDLDWEC